MTTRRKRDAGKDTGQAGLFADPTDKPRRVELAVGRAIAAAQREHDVDAKLDGGMAALARELGRAVDQAGLKRDAYGVAAASRELREVLGRMRLDPTARRGGTDAEQAALAAILQQIATPSGPTPPQGAGDLAPPAS
jgi:hypothetical protein